MAIDKEYWKKMVFSKDSFPEIQCPTCSKGHLIPIDNSKKSEETSSSIESREYEEWEPSWINYRFTISLKCNYDKCRDVCVCIGNGWNEPDMEYDKVNDMWYEVYKPNYEPIYFIPALRIIPVNDSYSNDLKQELLNSFSHFFSDLSSCANKIRVCIEILMDEFGIKRIELVSGKRRNLSLHSRILKYKTKNSEVADYLLAIKWIGNTGSHYDNLTKDDILDAYMLLDFSLNKIYDKLEKEVKKLTKEIIKKKAPLSKRRKKSGT